MARLRSLPLPSTVDDFGRPVLCVRFQELTQVSVIDHSLLLDHISQLPTPPHTPFSTYSLDVHQLLKTICLLTTTATSDRCF